MAQSFAQNQFRLRPADPQFAKIFDVAACQDGGALITGYKDSLSGNFSRPLLAKLDDQGQVEWSKSFKPQVYTGTYDGEGIACLELPDSSIIWMYRGAEQSATLSRLSSSGTPLWTRRVGGFSDAVLGGIAYLPTGYIALTAIATSTNAGVALFDLNGNMQWFRRIGLTNRTLLGEEIISNSNGDVLVAGSYLNSGGTQSGAWIGKLDSLGNLTSHRTYFYNNGAHPQMTETSNGDVILALRGNSTTYSGKFNMLIARLDSSLLPVWSRAFEHQDGLYALSVVEALNGNLLFTGELGTGNQSRMFTVTTDGTGGLLSSHELQMGGLPVWIEHMRITANSQGVVWASGGRHILRTDSSLEMCQTSPLSLSLDSNIILSTNSVSTTIQTFAPVSTPSQIWYDPGFSTVPACSIACQVNPQAIVSGSIFCPGDSIFFTNTTAGNYNFEWIKDGVVFGTGRDAAILAPAAGTYSVWLIAQDGNCIDSLQLGFSVDSIPPVSIGGAGPFCDNDPPDTLSGSPVGGVFSGPGVTGNQFSPQVSGIGMHIVTYTFTTPAGCLDSAGTTINVDLCTGAILPEIPRPQVFPNPSPGIFRVPALDGIERAEIEVVDAQGRAWIVQPNYDNGILDLRALPDGIYLLRLRTPAIDFTQRLLKR